MLTVARETFLRMATSRPLLALGLSMLVILALLAHFSASAKDTFPYFVMEVFVMAFVSGAGIVGRDIETGAIVLLAIKPITRPSILGGKLVGHLGFLAVFLLLAGAVAMIFCPVTASSLPVLLPFALFDLFVLASALLAASAFLPRGMNSVYLLMIWVAMALLLLALKGRPAAAAARRAIDAVMPASAMTMGSDLLNGVPLDWTPLFGALSRALAMLLLAVVVFNRRQLGLRS